MRILSGKRQCRHSGRKLLGYKWCCNNTSPKDLCVLECFLCKNDEKYPVKGEDVSPNPVITKVKMIQNLTPLTFAKVSFFSLAFYVWSSCGYVSNFVNKDWTIWRWHLNKCFSNKIFYAPYKSVSRLKYLKKTKSRDMVPRARERRN